jgi:hypothetical protein
MKTAQNSSIGKTAEAGAARLTGRSTIEAYGQIQLGKECLLLEEPRIPEFTAPTYSAFRPADGTIAPVDMPPLARPGELPTRRLDWVLRPTDSDLCITDAGLLGSYGIFGASGSGKTRLVLHMLQQLLALWRDEPERRYGGLILDPKAAMIEDIQEIMHHAERDDDLVVLENDELKEKGPVNIIDCALDPNELGSALVLAGQSAGAAATEPYWFGAWKNLFTAVVPLLHRFAEEPLSLRLIAEAVLLAQPTGRDGRLEMPIQQRAREAATQFDCLDESTRRDMRNAISAVENFYAADPKEIGVVQSLISTAYGGFLRSRWDDYSGNGRAAQGLPLYDSIIENGKVILVSVSPFDADMAKVICTIVKCLFQRSVLGRLARARAGDLTNFTRPLLVACDEYSDVASEVPGQPMGDAHFFSNARQFGCMGLMATQSVNRLQASSLKDSWRAVFSAFGGKVFMRLNDNETTEEATKLAGELGWYVTSLGTSQQKDGSGSSTNTDRREQKSLPSAILTQTLATRQAAFIGKHDGSGGSKPGTFFFEVADDRRDSAT